MLKEKLFRLLFPGKAKTIDTLLEDLLEYDMEVLKEKPTGQFAFQFDFTEVDEFGKPPHYLDGLTDEGRKHYLGNMESIYSDDRFHDVIKYCINLYGNKGMQVMPEEHMRDCRYAILGIKSVLEEFENAHTEFMNSKKQEEEFDPLAPLPE